MTMYAANRRLNLRWLVGAGLAFAALTSAHAWMQTPASAAPVSLKVSDPTNVAGAPIYIALDQGYFRDVGLEVELVPMNQTEVIQNVATGQVQFGMSLPSPALFNALERGIAVKIVASAIVNQETDRPAVIWLTEAATHLRGT